jgi:hypothetical protein
MAEILLHETSKPSGLTISPRAETAIEQHLSANPFSKPKTNRKEYLKLKARERRARQKEKR